MKKILKKYRLSNRDDFPVIGRHIHSLRILAFASEGIKFTEEETAHFEVCRGCRLKVIGALRNLAALVPPVLRHYYGECLNTDSMPLAE